ncbi:MAG: ribosome biogenesis GTPase Der [Actinobacteria bacterium]|nr:ribosome biogenesis GTPase Der [Actinomycetota bacterium]MBW3643707.1 ribosome biogenesis GTPase Der [Actinomycetota bacterium]
MPTVAIVGRPNVGKSTLLNRIVGRREAIVEERPGVTRDRKAVEADWCGHRFLVVDTGGWSATNDPLDASVSRQAERAWAEADVVLLVVDVTVGMTPEDAAVAAKLRGGATPVVVVANKVDGPSREPDVWELVKLGLGDPYPVSALHGRGSGDLLDAVVALLPAPESHEVDSTPSADEKVPAVAIVGRPNVGKSTLFNRLSGDERSVVHDLPGTTRDTVDTEVETPEGRIRFVDTAGMRRRSRIDGGTEYYSLVRALQAVDAADLAVLVIDASEGITSQDQRLAERIDAAGCPTVVLLNKWETLDAEARAQVQLDVADRLHFLSTSPVIKGSALTGKSIHKVLPALGQAVDAYRRRVPTGALNQVLQAAQSSHPSPGGRVLYATQGAIEPPTFTLFANRDIPPTYLRYLERAVREHFGFGNTPIKLRVRRRSS